MSCLVWLVDVAPSWAQQYRVLTVLAASRQAPGSIAMDQVLQQFLTEHLPGTLDYYSEYLDVARFDDPDYVVVLREFLRHKYANQSFDAVVAPTNASVEFLRGYRDELFPGVPIVFSGGPGLTPGPNSTGVTHTIDLASTIDMAVRLQPGLEQVYVVSGAAPFDKYYEDIAREQLRRWEDQLSITFWSGLPLNDLLDRAAHLPPNAILYSLTVVEDGAGQRFLPLDSLDRIAGAANVPIYHFSNLAMDHGIVGGALNNTHVLAGHLAELTLRVLRGEKPDDIPVVPVDILVEEVDWRQLRRWGISEPRVPAGTVVRFRAPGAWERYRRYIMATGAVVLVQTALIAGLLVQRRRRQRTEVALRVSYERNQDLVGRLITAQEGERSRIARDLHDDVSQELAGLAISLSMLRGRVNEGKGAEDLGESLAQLQHRTVSLGENIRTLSHELHPGVLQHAGLVPALKSYCEEFERHQRIHATFEANGDVSDLDPDVALCLYRAAQEALTNTARHSRAGSVQVALRRSDSGIDLEVSDDGAGFDSSQLDRMGLGLRSIDERVRLTRGITRVESQPGRGTRLLVSIPISGEPRGNPVVQA